MLTVLVLFVLVYLVSIGVTGKWLYANIAVPVFNYFGIESVSPSPVSTDSAINTPGATSTPQATTASTQTIEKTLSISGFTDYMVQLGAYDNEDNAKTDASTYKQKGAAGYVVSADKYRVIAASYQSKATAESIQSSIKSSLGADTVLYEYSVPKLEFKITATEQQITTIENIFNNYIKIKNNLIDLALSLDKSETDTSAAKSKLEEYKNTLNDYLTSLKSLVKGNSDNVILNGLNTLYQDSYNDVNSICSGTYSSTSAMSIDIKYACIKMTDKYSAFLTSISK